MADSSPAYCTASVKAGHNPATTGRHTGAQRKWYTLRTKKERSRNDSEHLFHLTFFPEMIG
jgi:hypothetical protein